MKSIRLVQSRKQRNGKGSFSPADCRSPNEFLLPKLYPRTPEAKACRMKFTGLVGLVLSGSELFLFRLWFGSAHSDRLAPVASSCTAPHTSPFRSFKLIHQLGILTGLEYVRNRRLVWVFASQDSSKYLQCQPSVDLDQRFRLGFQVLIIAKIVGPCCFVYTV